MTGCTSIKLLGESSGKVQPSEAIAVELIRIVDTEQIERTRGAIQIVCEPEEGGSARVGADLEVGLSFVKPYIYWTLDIGVIQPPRRTGFRVVPDAAAAPLRFSAWPRNGRSLAL